MILLTGQDSNLRTHDPKSWCPAIRAPAIASPPPVPTRASCPYRGPPDAGPEGESAPERDRTSTTSRPQTPQACASTSSATSACEPLLGVEPSRPPVRRAAGRRSERHGSQARIRTSVHGVRVRCPAARRPGNGTGGGSRTRTNARFELAAYCQLGYARVRRLEFEPRTRGLRVHCSNHWS
jgi:hypothetical protein